MFSPSSSAVIVATKSAGLGQDVAVQQSVESTLILASYPAPPPATLAYRLKKYHAFHSGISTWRTPSRMPCSVTIRLPPRRIGRRHQEPAHRVRAVAVEHLADVGVVAQRLAHLLPVAAQHDAVADAAAERRPVEQRRGQDVHGVEPAAGLADVLDDEVARVVVLEPVRDSRTGSAPGRRASTRSRTRRPGRPRSGAWSTGPVGSSGLGRVSSSMYGRCRSGTSTPKSASSSAIEP